MTKWTNYLMAIYKTTINSFCYLLLTDKASTTQVTEFYINDLDGATDITDGAIRALLRTFKNRYAPKLIVLERKWKMLALLRLVFIVQIGMFN